MKVYNALYLSPMIPSFNLKETIQFFNDILNFSPVMDTETYAIYQKDNLTVHILRAGDSVGQMELYLEVSNVDELWDSIKEKVKDLKVKKSFNR